MGYVETKNLHKHFGEVRAVDGVDLDVKEGELLVLLGPSGCGKTTLMRMIAGLEQPTSGEIYIAGEQVDEDVPPRARGIAMVFQSYALYPHKTAFQNIAFPLEAVGKTLAAIRDAVEWAAGIFGIRPLLGRRPRQLSGGERQRVALARAVVRSPRVFLFDEPLSNLDAQLRALARFELKQFQRQIATTTIYVTHDQVEAMGLGDRIAVMNKGKVRQIGTPQEVYEYPADTFVARFLGSPPMNLVQRDAHTILGFRPETFLPKISRWRRSASACARWSISGLTVSSMDRWREASDPTRRSSRTSRRQSRCPSQMGSYMTSRWRGATCAPLIPRAG